MNDNGYSSASPSAGASQITASAKVAWPLHSTSEPSALNPAQLLSPSHESLTNAVP